MNSQELQQALQLLPDNRYHNKDQKATVTTREELLAKNLGYEDIFKDYYKE